MIDDTTAVVGVVAWTLKPKGALTSPLAYTSMAAPAETPMCISDAAVAEYPMCISMVVAVRAVVLAMDKTDAEPVEELDNVKVFPVNCGEIEGGRERAKQRVRVSESESESESERGGGGRAHLSRMQRLRLVVHP